MANPHMDLQIAEPISMTLRVEKQPVLELSTGRVGDYHGEYVADALFESQVFPTANKRMLNDFTVKAINYTEAPNASGGKTLTIGG